LQTIKPAYEILRREFAEEKQKYMIANESLKHEFKRHGETETRLEKLEKRLMCTDSSMLALAAFVNRIPIGENANIDLPEDVQLGTILCTLETVKVELEQARKRLYDTTAELQQLKSRLPVDKETNPRIDNPNAAVRPTIRVPASTGESTGRKRGRSSQGRPASPP
jgi:hypothetical protein